MSGLTDVIANRRWVRRNRPFPHVVAADVFVPEFYAELEDEFHRIERDIPETFQRNMGEYDASGADLDRFRDGPFGVFLSRSWHDMIAGVAGVRASGDVSASLHHHEPGSASGWPHNDLNPGWFGGEPAAPGDVRVPSDAPVHYQRGPEGPDVPAREQIRAVSILYYLGNPPWAPGDGGETGLFSAPRPDGLAAAVPPVNNSLVLFECTPFSWHTFLSNRVSPRNSVVMWLHRDRSVVYERWGADRIVGW
ncbi:2OG-Fe(II) oxygenase [Jatrophihabitans endophyticus]|uniref:2OG-Fe(II) oxygenase n=1 Tax=Jatrophihabitans endophyticus TaxID=1206085 RepID=UPI0019ECC6C1|nr:2OG-Fe(II) oxygenase [Jatrophihabitans endophyticus]MBE7186690.1 2OG-Fe(II) oxygenase [Jatrophihabitans endophyticus]